MALFKKDAKVRLTLSMTPVTKARIDALQSRTGSTSTQQVLTRAIALLDAVTTEEIREGGGKLAIVWPDGEQSIIIMT